MVNLFLALVSSYEKNRDEGTRYISQVLSVCVCVFLVLEVRPEVCVLCWNETLCFWPDSSDRRSVWTVTSWERVLVVYR